jgi:uncharacterized membrane protein YtjA (UPF0391 family)
MPGWALTFLILALVAGYLGFFSLAGLGAMLAKGFLAIFVVLLVVSVVAGRVSARRRS